MPPQHAVLNTNRAQQQTLVASTLSKPVVHRLPLPSLSQQQPSTHQISHSFLTLSQSGETKVKISSTNRKKKYKVSERNDQIDNGSEYFTPAAKRNLICSTLAFWKGRPLDSSFISTVDVLISARIKRQREVQR
jgi:hypothetical protein